MEETDPNQSRTRGTTWVKCLEVGIRLHNRDFWERTLILCWGQTMGEKEERKIVDRLIVVMCDLYKLGKAPMCASAGVVSSNIVYLSTDIDPQGEVRWLLELALQYYLDLNA